jgi:hypothetical protein
LKIINLALLDWFVELIPQKLFGEDLLNSRREVPLILRLDSKYNDLIWLQKLSNTVVVGSCGKFCKKSTQMGKKKQAVLL